jgi:hypothetical protein
LAPSIRPLYAMTAAAECYAGVGSRDTPPAMVAVCEQIARALAERGWRLRTGHAPGADQAFERGAGPSADVFLPWPGFERAVPVLGAVHGQPAARAFEIAREHAPDWAALRGDVRALRARNSHAVLGATLAAPARFAVCWTADGSLDGRGPGTDGTAHTLRLCAAFAVPVYNLARPDHLARVAACLDLPA